MDTALPAGPRNLIVEDHKQLLESITYWIGSLFPDIGVYGTTNGEDSIRLARQLMPDFNLMDLGLPGIKGNETLASIERSGIETCIVVTTSLEGDEYAERAAIAALLSSFRRRKYLPG